MSWDGYRFNLPMPTRANNLVRPASVTTKTGKKSLRLVKTRDGEAFRDSARFLLEAKRNQLGAQPLAGPVSVVVTFSFANLGADIDGPLKALFDAMKGIVWNDDRQVGAVAMVKRLAIGPETCTVAVYDASADLAQRDLLDFLQRSKAGRPRPKRAPRVKPLPVVPSYVSYRKDS